MRQIISERVEEGYSIQASCQAFRLPRASYYRHQAYIQGTPELAKADTAVRERVQQVALAWSCYGYRRITHELKRQGIRVNHKRVLRLMRQENVVRRPKKRFVTTTNSDHRLPATAIIACLQQRSSPACNSDHRLPVYPNLAAEMDVTAPDQLWVSDLTYIRLGHDFVYLAVVLDACSRRCLDWSLGRRLEAALATSALKMALQGESGQERKPQVHHSDRGVQYASGEYTGLLKDNGIQISMPLIKP